VSSLTFGYNISFIDRPLGGFGDISLSDDIFLGAISPSENIITSGNPEILRRIPLAPGLYMINKYAL
jgi:hypothetical protein